jgi:hypothetical protein
MKQVIAQLTPDMQLVVVDSDEGMYCASLVRGEWPGGNTIVQTVFSLDDDHVYVDDEKPPKLWMRGTAYRLPWAELLKVADFLKLDIPLPPPAEGTEVAS